jgi:hypothetical protein
MQTTAGGKRFGSGTFKAAVLIIGVTGLLTAGAAFAITREETSSTIPAAAGPVRSIDPDEARRLELDMIREHELYTSPRNETSAVPWKGPEQDR